MVFTEAMSIYAPMEEIEKSTNKYDTSYYNDNAKWLGYEKFRYRLAERLAVLEAFRAHQYSNIPIMPVQVTDYDEGGNQVTTPCGMLFFNKLPDFGKRKPPKPKTVGRRKTTVQQDAIPQVKPRPITAGPPKQLVPGSAGALEESPKKKPTTRKTTPKKPTATKPKTPRTRKPPVPKVEVEIVE